jgi:hypothetical protein
MIGALNALGTGLGQFRARKAVEHQSTVLGQIMGDPAMGDLFKESAMAALANGADPSEVMGDMMKQVQDWTKLGAQQDFARSQAATSHADDMAEISARAAAQKDVWNSTTGTRPYGSPAKGELPTFDSIVAGRAGIGIQPPARAGAVNDPPPAQSPQAQTPPLGGGLFPSAAPASAPFVPGVFNNGIFKPDNPQAPAPVAPAKPALEPTVNKLIELREAFEASKVNGKGGDPSILAEANQITEEFGDRDILTDVMGKEVARRKEFSAQSDRLEKRIIAVEGKMDVADVDERDALAANLKDLQAQQEALLKSENVSTSIRVAQMEKLKRDSVARFAQEPEGSASRARLGKKIDLIELSLRDLKKTRAQKVIDRILPGN